MIPDITTSLTGLIAWASIGYLLGSVPFGIVIARALGLGDLRQIGSGNIGATNVLRTGSKLGAFLTLILDAGKAGIAALLALVFAGPDAAQLAGFAAFVGHCFPIWLRFKGGKGVATFFGLLFALAWPVGLATGATWLAIAGVFRYSSFAALISSAAAIGWAFFLGFPQMIALCLALAIMIYWRHGENIQRIKDGTETKIGQK